MSVEFLDAARRRILQNVLERIDDEPENQEAYKAPVENGMTAYARLAVEAERERLRHAEAERDDLRRQVARWERKEVQRGSCCADNEERVKGLEAALRDVHSMVSLMPGPGPHVVLDAIEAALAGTEVGKCSCHSGSVCGPACAEGKHHDGCPAAARPVSPSPTAEGEEETR
jgi:hypothetical protein